MKERIVVTEKLCRRCNTTKSAKEFGTSKSRPSGLQDWCRDCVKSRAKERYDSAGWRKTQAWNNARRLNYYDRVTEYLKTHPCVDCGEADPVVLEFDHRDPDKKKSDISKMMGKVSWKKIEKEIRKCDVVCSNCHRKRTAAQFGWRRWRQGQEEINDNASTE
mgnify:CR=1 FL=1